MADRPIPFSLEMARACWEGRETQTRRVISNRGAHPEFRGGHGDWDDPHCWGWMNGESGEHIAIVPPRSNDGYDHWFNGGIRVGDRLWLREPWRTFPTLDDLSPAQIEVRDRSTITYLATPEAFVADGRYRHARFMPKWASRMTLLVTGVKIERLQDITPDDALAEGIYQVKLGDFRNLLQEPEWLEDEPDYRLFYAAPGDETEDCMKSYPDAAFAVFWNSINGNREGCAWGDNPWVAAYLFEVHRTNIDQMDIAA